MHASELLRAANERLEEIEYSVDLEGADDTRHHYACECDDLGCMERVELNRAEYETVRADPLRFVVAAGHLDPAIDRLVERKDSFAVVEKARPEAVHQPTIEVSGMIEFSVKVEQLGKTYVVAVGGEVDLYTAPAFERELLTAIGKGGQQFVVDLTEATFIDSTFLGVLIDGNKRLNGYGGRLSIVCGDSNLTKIFQITGLDRIFTIHPTRDRATRAEELAAVG